MKKLLITILVLTFLVTISFAETFENTKTGLSIWIPDDWKTTNKQGIITADAPDGNAFIVLEILEDAKDIKTAFTLYEKMIEEYFKDYIEDSGLSLTQYNGLTIESHKGTGFKNSEGWYIDTMLIDTGEVICISISAVSVGGIDIYVETFEKIKASLQKR